MNHKGKAKELLAERDALDRKIEELLLVLETNNSTMDSSLVDAEGFPLNNIDVYAVRHARHDLICLKNDREELTKKITVELEEAHTETALIDEVNSLELQRTEKAKTSENLENDIALVHRTSNQPFAKISSVTSNSPSNSDGLKANDELIQYGSLHFGNFKDLSQLAKITGMSENKVIRVTVCREGRPVRLELRPRKWTGPGLLGCNIIPLSGASV